MDVSSEVITVGMCANSTGDHKLPLILVHKSKQPDYLLKKNKSSDPTWPVYFMSQSEAWLENDMFEEWFANEFVPSVEQYLDRVGLEKKALLLMARSPAHSVFLSDANIKCMFIPAPNTPLVQTLDNSAIGNLKKSYRLGLLNEFVQNHNGKISLNQFINGKSNF